MKYPQIILSWCKITKLWLDQTEGACTQLTGAGSSFIAFMSCISSFRRLSFLVLGKWHKIRRWHNPGHNKVNKQLLQLHYTIHLHLHQEQHLDRKANHQKRFCELKLETYLSWNLGWNANHSWWLTKSKTNWNELTHRTAYAAENVSATKNT